MYVQRDNESLSHNNIHSDKMDLSHVHRGVNLRLKYYARVLI